MDDDLAEVERRLRIAAHNGRTVRRRAGEGPSPAEKFRGLYDDVMDELAERAEERGVNISSVRLAHEATAENPGYLTSHDELMEDTGLEYHEARQAAAVLSDLGDLHECYDDDWNLHWVRCSEFIREKCEERRISLCRYYQMYDILRDFQDKVIGWYVRRNRRQSQPINLRELKAQYVERIQREHFPDKPVGEEWSRHIAARYLRTAQDEIIRAYDLSY